MFFKRRTKAHPKSEAELLAQYKATESLETLGNLYEPYMDLVFAICYKYLRDEEESKDAVMQIFEHLIEKLKTQNIENFRNWLHSVTRNHCLMILRSAKSKKFEGEIVELSTDEHQLYEVFEIDKNLTKLDDCLEKLSDEQKASIKLFYYQEKCYQEIVELTGYELNKVKSYIQNGKRNLKNCVENNNE